MKESGKASGLPMCAVRLDNGKSNATYPSFYEEGTSMQRKWCSGFMQNTQCSHLDVPLVANGKILINRDDLTHCEQECEGTYHPRETQVDVPASQGWAKVGRSIHLGVLGWYVPSRASAPQPQCDQWLADRQATALNCVT